MLRLRHAVATQVFDHRDDALTLYQRMTPRRFQAQQVRGIQPDPVLILHGVGVGDHGHLVAPFSQPAYGAVALGADAALDRRVLAGS
jgi:hypothetical protein